MLLPMLTQRLTEICKAKDAQASNYAEKPVCASVNALKHYQGRSDTIRMISSSG
jgi:hypothetical protein